MTLRSSKLVPCVVALLLAALPAMSADDLTTLEAQLVDYYTGGEADAGNVRVASSLRWLETVVAASTRSGLLLQDGSWSDLDYTQIPTGSWSPGEHTKRTFRMAQAYRTPGQRFYRDPVLLGQIESSLAFVQVFYGPLIPSSGNWWFWRIGIPLDLCPTVILMRGHASDSVIEQTVDAIVARIGSNPFTYPGGSLLKGQNLVWASLNHLHIAALTRNATLASWVAEAMRVSTQTTSGRDGLQEDHSFHQHGPQLYTGGYGGAFGNDVAKYLLLTRDSTLALPIAARETLADYVIEGLAWSIHQNYFDVSVIGREVARSSASGYHGLAALLQMSLIDSPRKSEIERACSKMLESWDGILPPELATIAATIERGAIQQQWPSGHRHQFASDYTIHRRERYFASIKMLSSRTISGEATNGENLFGSLQSDGRFSLILSGKEYYGHNVWPTLDWSRLPGITVEQRAGAADASYGYGSRSFVGGTGDGQNGVSAMDFAKPGSSLTARKSWFFFDDAIVFLTSGIQCLSGAPAETIVQQWPLSSLDTPLIINGIESEAPFATQLLMTMQWALSDGVGYYFFDGAPVTFKRELRSGTWASLGAEGGQTAAVTNPILTLWLDHGSYPTNASAAYAIVPNTNPAAMSSWVASRPFSILANDERVAAVRDNRTGAIGVVFWQPGAIAGIESDTPSVVYLSRTGSTLRVTIADPTQGAGALRLGLPSRLSLVSSNVPVIVAQSPRTTEISLPRNEGRIVDMTFLSVPARRRGARSGR